MIAEELHRHLDYSRPKREKGGQQVGCTDPTVIVSLPNVIKIECNVYRSSLKNRKLAVQLIELATQQP